MTAQQLHDAYTAAFGTGTVFAALPDHRQVRWGMVVDKYVHNVMRMTRGHAFYEAYWFDAYDDLPPWTGLTFSERRRWETAGHLVTEREQEAA